MPLLKYATVTSYDVEGTFSAYRHILLDKRQSMTPENTKRLLIVYCASTIKDYAKKS
jgi:hypothetical protein